MRNTTNDLLGDVGRWLAAADGERRFKDKVIDVECALVR